MTDRGRKKKINRGEATTGLESLSNGHVSWLIGVKCSQDKTMANYKMELFIERYVE